MVKQRFTSADVAAEVACVRQRCLGMRVANVYDINPKTYVLKLIRSGDDGDKVLLLIESGVRFHTVQAMPDKADTPSNFTLKLRKHIRTRRLEAAKQLGEDRVVQLTFGSGPAACHLLLEFYAQGNVILADEKYEVLTLLRSHRDDAKGVAIMARHLYPIHTIRLRQPLRAAALEAALAAAPPGTTLAACLGELLPYGPLICQHCVLTAALDPGRSPAEAPLSSDERAALLGGVRRWEDWLDACEASSDPPKGYILTRPQPQGQAQPAAQGAAAQGSGAGGEGVYDEFQPLLLAQHQHRAALEFPSFDAALAEFFGKIQGQRAAQQQAAKEKAAVGKLEAIRRDHEQRLGTLGREAEAAELKAALIEYNLGAVDAALNAVREAVASGMDWRELGRMVKEERRAGNPVAGLIDSLQLEGGRITLLLSNWLDEEEGDEEAATRPATKVEVDLALSAHANARVYYDSRRKHQSKQQKTLDANQKALKAAEKKAQQQLKQVRSATAPVITRKPFWFEKFHWFISSENYLVLSGRDAQQNELLVKRYLRRGDVYVHADLHGASTTIIRNHDPAAPIPALTLSQAGQACVCRSQAWDAKVVTSAWWVHPEQVSKTAPTGEYLVTGSFMIRGKKNYLPPQPLVMGYGFLFGLAEESIPAHVGERAPRQQEDDGAGSAAGLGGSLEADDGEAEQGGSSEGEEAEEQQPGSARAAPPSALDAFLDASADTLAGGAAGGPARRGSSSASGAADNLVAAFERYGLADTLAAAGSGAAAAAAAAEEEEEGGAGKGGGEGGRRHLSAKQRQLMKKQQQGKPPQQPQHQQKQGGGGGGGPAKQAAPAEAASSAAGAAAGRGGKGKKGGRGKYAGQDEEDRLLAQQLLQSAGQKKDRKQRKEERKARLAARKAERSGLPQQEITADDIARLTARPAAAESGGEGAEDAGDLSDDSASSSRQQEEQGEEQREVQQEQLTGQQQEGPAGEAAAEGAAGRAANGAATSAAVAAPADGGGDEAAEVAALLKEENLEALGEEDREKLTQLDQLTGVPRGDDILLFAVPVCAPYTVLAGYKHRVKLVPGTLKKGKAVRQAAELLLRAPGVGARERDLIRAVPEPEAINCLCGTVKIQSAGLLKLKQAQKKGKK